MPETILSVSGGKDSTAMYLLALERREARPGWDFRAVFADTGNEHEWTLDYVASLAQKTGGPPVETITPVFTEEQFARKRRYIAEVWPTKFGIANDVCDRAIAATKPSGNPFLDVCILRSGFPGVRQRFCTDRLKISPIRDQVYTPIWAQGKGVIVWQGIRRDESPVRADALMLQRLVPDRKRDGKLVAYRPLVDWTLEDVWRMHRRHSLEPNPLYAHGMSRVGCMPCIYEKKNELRIIAERFPHHIDRIREWENIVSLASRSASSDVSFFNRSSTGYRGTKRHANIDAVVQWSQTARGNRGFDLIPITDVRADLLLSCGEWGACE